MKLIELPDEIAVILEKIPPEKRAEFLTRHGLRLPQEASLPSSAKFRLFTDGASRGNPGPAGIGYLLRDESGKVLHEGKRYLGVMTNNVAEWTALLSGLQKARELGVRSLECFLDSELVVKQMRGEYKIKQANLRTLAVEVRKLVAEFNKITFEHIPREKNFRADQLSNEAIDDASL